ncbi:MAG: Zn-ribbon domain-containing OB-fold protein [Methanobacteriota archaeon]
MTTGSGKQGAGSRAEGETIDAKWEIPYRHVVGPHATRFLAGLRDEKRIRGIRCPACRRVFVPPRAFCEACFVDTTEWVDVADTGVVHSVTIQYEAFPGLPKPPYAVGLVKLDGADTAMLAFLGGVPLTDSDAALAKIGIGRRVKAVWKEAREGRVTDILHFGPIG